MIRFDHTEYQFADDSGHLLFNLCTDKDGQLKQYWSFHGRLCCVDEPVRRGDLAGRRVLDLFLSGAECSVGHWQELSGATDARTQPWELFKAVLLVADPDDKEPALDIRKKTAMSLAHEFKLGAPRGYHFPVEGHAIFLPFGEASQVAFGGTSATPDELKTVAQELHILEFLPLTRVGVSVPRTEPDPVGYARHLAKTNAGLDDLVPWPGQPPHYQPVGPPPKADPPGDTFGVYFVTPWARDTEP